MRRFFISGGVLSVLAACSTVPDPAPTPKPQDMFMKHIGALCGQSFEGKVVSNDAVDADWRAEKLTIYVRDCSSREIKIPLHVGENRSRTWIISQTDTGLRLKHDHRHEDGSPDAVTMYGGDTQSEGSATQQAFPADDYSKELFEREFLTESVNNTWTVEIDPGSVFRYSLSRPGRDFRAEFDLTKPVATPPPVW